MFKLFKGERLFHSTPRLVHISSRFDNDLPGRLSPPSQWHVCLLESLQQAGDDLSVDCCT